MINERVVIKLNDGREVTGTVREVLGGQLQVAQNGDEVMMYETVSGILLYCGPADVCLIERKDIDSISLVH